MRICKTEYDAHYMGDERKHMGGSNGKSSAIAVGKRLARRETRKALKAELRTIINEEQE